METRLLGKLHVAIIMDGNGRWASERGLPRPVGHKAGTETVGRVVDAALAQGLGSLTLYAFSSDNWKRPKAEVSALFGLLGSYLDTETSVLAGKGVRLGVIGRRDRLAAPLVRSIAEAERATLGGARLHLRVAIDYSSRHEMAKALGAGADPTRLADAMGTDNVDLLIRTGGEQRLSDFMLWECAYAELHFTPMKWPDFGAMDLEAALAAFAGRQRRFGGLIDQAA